MQYSVYAVRCGERIAHLKNGVGDGLTRQWTRSQRPDRLACRNAAAVRRERTDVVEPDERDNNAVELEHARTRS